MKKIKLILTLSILITGLFAVINQYENSYSTINNINTPFESITMTEVDIESLLREDEENSGTGVPIRFAHGFDVDYGINNSGTWEETEDGGKLWRLGFHSAGAYGMKIFTCSFCSYL